MPFLWMKGSACPAFDFIIPNFDRKKRVASWLQNEYHVDMAIETHDEEMLWQAVMARDAARDGTFVFAVRSTGVYCRPSCPSRRPRRDQVCFFATPAEARAAGFRPCKRCAPDDPLPPPQMWVLKVCRLLEEAGRPLPLSDLSRAVGTSPSHLTRGFKSALGVTPRQYGEALRRQVLRQELRAGNSVTAAVYAAGYGSPARMYAGGAVTLGTTPHHYRMGGKGMDITYTLVDSPLGRLLVAGTSQGICFLSMGDEDGVMLEALRQEYPQAQIRPAGEEMRAWVSEVLAYLRGELPDVSHLPLDVQATAFQLRVWEELRRIPPGETRTYAQVAEALGNPKAVRAVARACATNPVSLVTPCHRVVRGDGSLAGYRWGVSRKRRLLEQEKQTARSAAEPEY